MKRRLDPNIRPSKGIDEDDAFSKASRQLYCCMHNNTGLVKFCQRQYWKRSRKKAKEELAGPFL